jgi:hypothetical protein
MTAGNCAVPYSNGRLTMEASIPWKITAVNDIPPGYRDSACIRCYSGTNIQDRDNFSVE